MKSTLPLCPAVTARLVLSIVVVAVRVKVALSGSTLATFKLIVIRH